MAIVNSNLGMASSEEDVIAAVPESASGGGSDEDGGSDSDSVLVSDEIDLSEFGDSGMEFCQVGNLCCIVPLDLYDLPDLGDVLSLETWNELLTEKDRFLLAEYLPGMDRESFAVTLKELFGGRNFHFGSPLADFFNLLKSGLCDPRIALYRQGLNLVQRQNYYHRLRKYHNCMVESIVQIKDAWQKCKGYGIEERLRYLNILRNQRISGFAKDGDLGSETDCESVDSAEAYWSKRFDIGHRVVHSSQRNSVNALSRRSSTARELVKFGKEKSKGNFKAAASKFSVKNSLTRKPGNVFLHYNYSKEKKSKMSRVLRNSGQQGCSPRFDSNVGRGRGDTDNCFEEQGKTAETMKRKKNSLPNIKGKKRKAGNSFRTAKCRPLLDSNLFSYKVPPAVSAKSNFKPGNRTKRLQGRLRSPIPNESEETQSQSLDHTGEDADVQCLVSKLRLSIVGAEGTQPTIIKQAGGVQNVSRSLKFSKKVPTKKKGEVKEMSHSQELNSVRDGVSALCEKLEPASLGPYAARKKMKRAADSHCPVEGHDLRISERGKFGEVQETEMQGNDPILSDYAFETDHGEKSSIPFTSADPLTENTLNGDNGYANSQDDQFFQQSSAKSQTKGSSKMKKKLKRKAGVIAASTHLEISEPIIAEKGVVELEVNLMAQKKPFSLIVPTIHTGFSFSIIHLLSAVRIALVTPHVVDAEEIGNSLEKEDGRMQVANGLLLNHFQGSVKASILEQVGQSSLPFLGIQDIVNRVRLSPGDPCILETQEPLHDLVRGVLKLFSSRTAPLGAKGWKALVSYQKSNRTWSWVGPLSSSSSDNDNAEEATSSETWGLPHKMLTKLVDAFANWLKSSEETLQQIGSLLPPPAIFPALDEKERFRDLKAQKSLNTIRPSSEEVRVYFRKEELLRYSIPDRAFQYTAVDGRKSTVAPLRRSCGKTTSKPRDHFMLKPNRPPHVTILCLVRDAASRLPGNIGTRADVCTLIRDSQYIVDDVSDTQVNQVVSGALDRLHYEQDPCVQFDGDRKLWVYLHREREDEDFEDDGTSSTKKWKRQKKDTTDDIDLAAVTELNYVSSGFEFNPDLNLVKNELVYNDLMPTMENAQDNLMSWEACGANSFQESKMICQENCRNEDFDDETFSRQRAAGLFGSSLL
ncbi:hypothetical protein AXF42_Ash020022 [Apostasia shenzhenica]|uniref:DEUBAD domain-containing protein n=1 Tax=Apostasia shenzhenica TaxID=1088818 RepID=A0A2H9ZSJ3_9ASPA|nr:hypothetical protein AXF42_Ash020022 [Apostasia shenzhenica]